MIGGDKEIKAEDTVIFKGSMLLTAQDIAKLFADKNKSVKSFNQLAGEKEQIIDERKQLQEELKEALAQGNVNIEEIINSNVKEATQKLQKQFENERS